jgi:hypothetical protein
MLPAEGLLELSQDKWYLTGLAYDGAAWRTMNAFDSKVLESVVAFVSHSEVREHYATKKPPLLHSKSSFVFRIATLLGSRVDESEPELTSL